MDKLCPKGHPLTFQQRSDCAKPRVRCMTCENFRRARVVDGVRVCDKGHPMKSYGVSGRYYCPECSRERAKVQEEKKRVRLTEFQQRGKCVRGHLYIPENLRHQKLRSGKVRVLCELCYQEDFARRKAGRENMLTPSQDIMLAEQVMALQLKLETAPHWEKDGIRAKIQSLAATLKGRC